MLGFLQTTPKQAKERLMTSSVLPENPEAMAEYHQAASGRRSKSYPADGRAYNPANANPDYGAKQHPLKTIVVLQTPGPDGSVEYRVAMVRRRDLEYGLRSGDGVSLNRHVAERCFKGQVYLDEIDALREAKNSSQQDDDIDGGIKVIQCHQQFPRVESS